MRLWRQAVRPRFRSVAIYRRPLLDGERGTSIRSARARRSAAVHTGIWLPRPRRDFPYSARRWNAEVPGRNINRRRRPVQLAEPHRRRSLGRESNRRDQQSRLAIFLRRNGSELGGAHEITPPPNLPLNERHLRLG